MQDLQIFKSEEFGEIRTTRVRDEAYLCLIDICKILDINNARQLKARLNQDGVITNDVIDTLGRTQQATFINESNLYKVIFQSRKPEAEKFIEWVTSEVLPSIRKNGGYILKQEELSDGELLAKAVLVAQNKIAEKSRQLEEAHRKIEEDSKKVLFADSVASSENCISVNEMAKLLKQNGIDIGEDRFFRWLRENRYLSREKENWNLPTQKSMDLELFKIKKSTYTADGKTFTNKTSKVTGKGQIYFINKFKESINKT